MYVFVFHQTSKKIQITKFKSILVLIHLIGYMDWIHFWIIQIVFWIGFLLGLIQVDSSQSWAKSAKLHIELSRLGPNRIELVWAKVEPSHFGPKSSRYPDERTRAHIQTTGPRLILSQAGPMSSWAGMDRCRVERARAQVEPSGLHVKPTSLGPIKQAWAKVEPSRPGLMSGQASSGPG